MRFEFDTQASSSESRADVKTSIVSCVDVWIIGKFYGEKVPFYSYIIFVP